MTASFPQSVRPPCFPMPARVLGTASPSSAGGGLAEISATHQVTAGLVLLGPARGRCTAAPVGVGSSVHALTT